jgi:leucyl aminopeptidase
MKGDMAGAAVVLGVFSALRSLKPNIRVIGLIPAVDNVIGPLGIVPEEVITYPNGCTVEITNTDAEGRLVLADALLRADQYHPDYVVDLATLNGECRVALGDVYAGLFCNSDDLQKKLIRAGEAVDERLWPLPLDESYSTSMQSPVADLKSYAGSLAGLPANAFFLSKFNSCNKWAHIDISGTFLPGANRQAVNATGATGFGVSLLTELFKILA